MKTRSGYLFGASLAAAILCTAGAALAHHWEAEFTNWSGTNASATSSIASSTGGTIRNFYVSHTQGTAPTGTWLSQDSGTNAYFNISGSSTYWRARLACYMEDTVRCDTGAAVGWRMNVLNTTNVNRGPVQFALTDGAGTEYNCYIVLVGGNQLIIKQNSGTAYPNIATKSVSITGWHVWTLTVQKLGDGLAHWRLLCDGTLQGFTGTDGTHTVGDVTYSFRTATNTYDVPSGERNQYIGLGELSTSYSSWSHSFDWVRWTDSGPNDPVVVQHPANQSKQVGETASFSVVARSFGTIAYQWQVNAGAGWSDIGGATSSSYTTGTLGIGDNGKQYRCRVSNTTTAGTDDYSYSNAATLTVSGAPTAPSNPGATDITTSSITWTWQDNSGDETGFKVYADPGAGPPSTLRATTAASVTSWMYSGLSANSQYAFQVAATNANGDSAKTANYARYTLALAPVYGASGDGRVDCDKGSGSSSIWYPAGTSITFTAVNGFGTGQARASKYVYVWNTSPGEPSWSGAPEWTSGNLIKTESATGSYYLHLRACNAEGVANITTLHLGPYQIDADGPSAPTVMDDGEFTTSTTQLHATWAASDPQSGIAEYQYAVSATQTEAGIITGGGWQSAGTDTEATRSGLSLEIGTTYYTLAKAKNGAGIWSSIGVSDGITVVSEGIRPLGMPNIWLGGADWRYDPGTGAGQRGIAGGVGLNTIGLPVRVWGAFTYVDPNTFTVDDGSGVNVRCVVSSGVTLNPTWQYVIVTGISTCHKDGSELRPLVRVRRQQDIVAL